MPESEEDRARRFRRIALELGDAIKYDRLGVNAIERAAMSTLNVGPLDQYAVDAITSVCAQKVYDWVMTLHDSPVLAEEADQRLREFADSILPADSEHRPRLLALASCSAPTSCDGTDALASLHPRIRDASAALYSDGHCTQAVFDAFKAIEVLVKEKSGLTDAIGQDLMFRALNPDNPLLVLGDLSSTAGKNRQDGFKFILGGAMRGIRNIGGHGDLDLDSAEALEHLVFASLLVRVVEAAEPSPTSSPEQLR